jgi:hypothetical protein
MAMLGLEAVPRQRPGKSVGGVVSTVLPPHAGEMARITRRANANHLADAAGVRFIRVIVRPGSLEIKRSCASGAATSAGNAVLRPLDP